MHYLAHATGTTLSVRGQGPGGVSCSQCHASQGYIQYIETGAVDQAGYTTALPLSCTTCHSNHTSFDFENDGYDYALRNIDPVKLVIDKMQP
ncbi:MAG: hypothetical protein U5K51_11375 [Flavobacteriaceae bacterium]|nr:hypothetical protein [Flavobacteriaceae bacterium]